MTKSYIDEVLERAENATRGPWGMIQYDGWTLLDERGAVIRIENDLEFIAHARTDIPELVRRLKKAITYLRAYDSTRFEKELADELESYPEKK